MARPVVGTQDFLFEHLMPDTSSEVESYLSEFSKQAKNLTGPGIVFLVITAVLMLRNIEKAFNQIWRARENRSAVSSFLLYWAVLSLAPVAMGSRRENARAPDATQDHTHSDEHCGVYPAVYRRSQLPRATQAHPGRRCGRSYGLPPGPGRIH